MKPQPIVVIGGSAGSIHVLIDLLTQLSEDLSAAIFVVVHLNRTAPSNLAMLLERKCRLPTAFARDQQSIKPGQVYIAPPDYHLFVKPGKIQLIRGPLENRMRPAIDVLFRSAAVAYQNSVTGIILSGMLDDGVVGLKAIKRCGGITIVQSPEEAQFPSMPESAIAQENVDHIVSVEDMGSLIEKYASQPSSEPSALPESLLIEAQMIERVMFNSDEMAQIGDTVAQSCPTCSGPLWKMKFPSNSLRYRCHVGHSFTAHSLLDAQDEASEEALWVALRTLEERGRLLERISEDTKQKGSHALAKTYQARAEEALNHANSIRRLLYSLGSRDTMAEETQERRDKQIG